MRQTRGENEFSEEFNVLFRSASIDQDPTSQLRLGVHYEEAKDIEKALLWYRKSASQGNVEAMQLYKILKLTANQVSIQAAEVHIESLNSPITTSSSYRRNISENTNSSYISSIGIFSSAFQNTGAYVSEHKKTVIVGTVVVGAALAYGLLKSKVIGKNTEAETLLDVDATLGSRCSIM